MEANFLELELGKQSEYESHYNRNKLFPIPRKIQRKKIGILDTLPFFGHDTWNHYEVSWLNNKGKPQISMAEIVFGFNSPNMVESKSMRLYFNSLNNTKFEHINDVKSTIIKDIATCVESSVFVELSPFSFSRAPAISPTLSKSIDDIDTEFTRYTVSPEFLFTEHEHVEETLHSELFRSNCLITDEPDWGSVDIAYTGKKINHEGLLKYIVSFRNHDEFLEHCIERMFMDIQNRCSPEKLTISGRYTRRGGLDINPVRSSRPILFENIRSVRQ